MKRLARPLPHFTAVVARPPPRSARTSTRPNSERGQRRKENAARCDLSAFRGLGSASRNDFEGNGREHADLLAPSGRLGARFFRGRNPFTEDHEDQIAF